MRFGGIVGPIRIVRDPGESEWTAGSLSFRQSHLHLSVSCNAWVLLADRQLARTVRFLTPARNQSTYELVATLEHTRRQL